ncbi:unnamed protein product [Timema podura]|uniref:Uncharacterized protein n=1 Tax=Timema podura TaxID=61482 RepID=A0ABN7NBW1_TIMPD|nr:unnamed protein product [Timema podura]
MRSDPTNQRVVSVDWAQSNQGPGEPRLPLPSCKPNAGSRSLKEACIYLPDHRFLARSCWFYGSAGNLPSMFYWSGLVVLPEAVCFPESGGTNLDQEEEEMRASLDPKYAHLSDDLHVEIAAFAPPAEAHARIAYALAELRKYLIPDANDEIRQEQMREMELIQTDPSVGVVGPNGTTQIGVRKPIRGGMRGRGGVGLRGAPALRGGGIPSLRGGGRGLLSPPGSLLPPRGGLPPSGVRKPMPPPQALLPRPIPTKTKVLSILDRARVAMEESYAMGEDDMGGGGFYDSSYNSYNATGYGSYEDYDEGTADYYDTTESYPDNQFTCSFFMSQYSWKGIDLLQFRVRRLLDIRGGLLFRGPPCSIHITI